MKRLMAFALLLASLFCCVLPVSAEAEVSKEERLYRLLEEGIRNKCGMDGKSYIDLSSLKLSNADGSADRELLQRTLKRVVFDHPEFYYVSYGYYRHHFLSDPNALAGLRPIYYEFAKDPETEQAFNEAVETALAQVEGISDPVEQMLVLHDYLLKDSVFNWETAIGLKAKDAPSYIRSPYGPLVAHDAVCVGYARAWQLLMNRLGIPCVTVNSTGNEHCWNLVQLDGAWYHMDINNDNNFVPTIRGRSMHIHFLQSDQARLKVSRYKSWYVLNPIDGNGSQPPACTSDKYDAGWAFNNKLNYLLYRKDGQFYYVRRTGSNRAAVLCGTLDRPGKTVAQISANNRSGAVWQGSFLYYVDAKDGKLKSCSLTDGKIAAVGDIPFTPQPSPDGHYGKDSDGIGLFFDAEKQEVTAVSRTRRTVLTSFPV